MTGTRRKRENYDISCVVADHPLGPCRSPDGGHEALLMRSRPGAIGLSDTLTKLAGAFCPLVAHNGAVD